MAKTRQILSLCECGKHYVCIFDGSKVNPYRVYYKWYDRGEHRRKVAEYADFPSVLYYLFDTYRCFHSY